MAELPRKDDVMRRIKSKNQGENLKEKKKKKGHFQNHDVTRIIPRKRIDDVMM